METYVHVPVTLMVSGTSPLKRYNVGWLVDNVERSVDRFTSEVVLRETYRVPGMLQIYDNVVEQRFYFTLAISADGFMPQIVYEASVSYRFFEETRFGLDLMTDAVFYTSDSMQKNSDSLVKLQIRGGAKTVTVVEE